MPQYLYADEDLALAARTSAAMASNVGESREPSSHASHLPDPSSSSQSHQRLGQYTVMRTLGEGSFGKVKLAKHIVSGQKVALKIISRRKLINRDMAGRVEREIQYLQLLRHPHIIKLYTVITTPSEIIMVLEYAGGELFNHIVTHGKVTEESARRFFQQMICAVEYCHRHKVVHRDLKPENVLLDDQLNVKIADFGLSNIMTDGNFLKTSCGSPNYAAPEVISGKLYAGPEVDVWSCGVILYVMLCGGLPFDDEYIPALFKKIAQGNYTIPSYVPPGAAHLIRRMLVVNSVHRITVQEIRQDPWFLKNLPDYLQPPVQDFIDTGVDPNKAINPKALAPGKPPADQERLHQDVVGKLGKTMGYAKDDVQDALGKDEPSAIKDAYLIVRENQIMKTSGPFTEADEPQSSLTPSSPLTSETTAMSSDQGLSAKPGVVASPVTEKVIPGDLIDEEKKRTKYKTSIAVLPSSLPEYHRAYMKKLEESRVKENETREVQAERQLREQLEEEQAPMAKHLKSHSRSQHNADKANAKPEGLTPIPSKKPKQLRWQFGIRSRNPPLDAMLCLYRAIAKSGAEWEDPEADDDSYHGSVDVGDNMTEAQWSGDGSNSDVKSERPNLARPAAHPQRVFSEVGPYENAIASSSGSTDSSVDITIPDDPWIIRCRWLKDSLGPSGSLPNSSSRSSKSNLAAIESAIKAASDAYQATEGAHAHPTHPRHSASGSMTTVSDINDKIYVYGDVQLYQIERDFYMVDFKCAGYERVIEMAVDTDMPSSHEAAGVHTAEGESGPSDRRTSGNQQQAGREGDKKNTTKRKIKKRMGRRFRPEEKTVSSPFPFLDIASKLIIALAEGD